MNTFLSIWHIYFTLVCPVLYLRHSLCYKKKSIMSFTNAFKITQVFQLLHHKHFQWPKVFSILLSLRNNLQEKAETCT